MRISPKKIMCAVDFSDYTENVLAYSVGLCKAFDAKLYLAHVVVDVSTLLIRSEVALDVGGLQMSHIESAREHLESICESLPVAHDILISQGDPVEMIRRLALDNDIDLLITATHGKSGMKRLLIGSVTAKLLKTAHCPLLALHTDAHNFIDPKMPALTLDKILVGCDFSPDSKLAFDYGLSLAQEFQAKLYLAHVVKPTEYIELKSSNYIDVEPGDYITWRTSDYYEMQKRMTEERRERTLELRAQLEKQLYFMVPEESRNWCHPQTVLLDGEPYKELLQYATDEGINLIVLGIHGHTLWEELMVGSTTDRVIRQSPCPVLAVRQAVAEEDSA